MSGQPRADQIATEAHYHSADSTCLTRVEAVATDEYRDGQPIMVPAAHWWRCAYLADLERTAPWRGDYPIHEHGPVFHAHEPLARCEFPA